MSDDQNESPQQIPRWAIFLGLSVATYVGYRLLLQPSPIRYKHNYVEMTDKDLGYYPKGEKYWATKPNESVQIRFAKQGPASWKPKTVFEVFDKAVNNDPHSTFYTKEYKNDNGEYEWQTTSRLEFFNKAKQAARGFIHLGLQPFQSVVCIGFNSPEWFIADLGAIYAGMLNF